MASWLHYATVCMQNVWLSRLHSLTLFLELSLRASPCCVTGLQEGDGSRFAVRKALMVYSLKKKKKAHLSQHLHPSLPFYILHQHSLALSSLLIYIFILLDNCISSDYTIINIHGANSQTLCSHRPVIKPGHSNVSLTNC